MKSWDISCGLQSCFTRLPTLKWWLVCFSQQKLFTFYWTILSFMPMSTNQVSELLWTFNKVTNLLPVFMVVFSVNTAFSQWCYLEHTVEEASGSLPCAQCLNEDFMFKTRLESWLLLRLFHVPLYPHFSRMSFHSLWHYLGSWRTIHYQNADEAHGVHSVHECLASASADTNLQCDRKLLAGRFGCVC